MTQTAPKFFGTTLLLGLAMASCWDAALATPALLIAALKLGWEALYLANEHPEHDRTRRLLLGPLRWWHVVRFSAGLLGAAFVLHSPPLGFALLFAGELLERALFFRAAAAWRMPRSA
jgi:DMSO reductase anchor subunit